MKDQSEPKKEKEKRQLNNPRLSKLMTYALRNEPQKGYDVTKGSSDDLIPANVTKKLQSEADLIYRLLFLKQTRELVLIIPPKITGDAIKKGLQELKELSKRIQEGQPQIPMPGFQMYLEYEHLREKYGWSLENVWQQVSYDYLITLMMIANKNNPPELIEYAKYIQKAIFQYMHIKQTQIPDYLSIGNSFLAKGQLPFIPSAGFVFEGEIEQKLADARKAWNKKRKRTILIPQHCSILLTFWLVCALEGYWAIIDSQEGMDFLNKENRDGLQNKFMSEVFGRQNEWTDMLGEDLIKDLTTDFYKTF